MDIIFEMGQATAADIHEHLPEPPSYSAVRAMLVKLENKGHLRHKQDGPRYVYSSTVPHREAQQKALDRLVRVFFENSPVKAVNALLDHSESLSGEELDTLKKAIEEARRKGR